MNNNRQSAETRISADLALEGAEARLRGADDLEEAADLVLSDAGASDGAPVDWGARSRQTLLVMRFFAVFWLFLMFAGWPLGDRIAYMQRNNGSAEGWSYLGSLSVEVVILALFMVAMTALVGFILTRQMLMTNVAQQIALAARQFVDPMESAAHNARSVGSVVRGELAQLNVGLDGALTRLAAVEAMIRRHVEAIEYAGVSLEDRTSGAISVVGAERARLIELTEQLNVQADAFAAAIAAKAQASIDSVHSADDFLTHAQANLEDRMQRLDAVAARALDSFRALSEAISSADGVVRGAASAIDESAERTRRATTNAAAAADAAAESAARNAANVIAAARLAAAEASKAAEDAIATTAREVQRIGDFAAQSTGNEAARIASVSSAALESLRRDAEGALRAASADAEQSAASAAQFAASALGASTQAALTAETAIEVAAREAEKASRAAIEATEREAARIADASQRALESMRRTTQSALTAASEDAARATGAAEEIANAARRAAEAASLAAAELAKAGQNAKQQADSAIDLAQLANARMDERNKALAETRAALEAENARLEELIQEQRRRADRLADAIATQTERLSKLAETQLREQEAQTRLAEAQAALRVRAAEEARISDEMKRADEARRAQEAKLVEAAKQAESARQAEEFNRLARAAKTADAATGIKTSDATAQGASPEEDPLDLGVAAREVSPGIVVGSNENAPARNAGQSNKTGAAKSKNDGADVGKRGKQDVSWREILDATDDAEPLDLAAHSNTAPRSPAAPPRDAMAIISDLQAFTADLERRLYGDPPPALKDRFDRGDRNVFASRLLRLNEADVKRRLRAETARDKGFDREVHAFLQGFEKLLEDATTSQTVDEDLEEYLSSPLGRVYLLIGATVGYFA